MSVQQIMGIVTKSATMSLEVTSAHAHPAMLSMLIAERAQVINPVCHEVNSSCFCRYQ